MIKIEIYEDIDGEWSELRINDGTVAERHHLYDCDIIAEKLEEMGIVKHIEYQSEDGILTVDGTEVDWDDVPIWVRDHHENHLANKESGW